ncbi:MAG: glutamine synthetase family protein, partial [Pseudomonadota bacterium]
DIEDSPLVFETGDQDGVLRPTERGPVPMPWLEGNVALLPMGLFTDDGAPFAGDPRHALAGVLQRYAARGWSVTAATEMEFYLEADAPHPLAERLGAGSEILSLQALEAHDAFFAELYATCAAMGVAADAASSEAAPGQFEINLKHCDAMRAADDAWLFKMAVKGVARRHGMHATFMAKPYPEESGNGLHVHFSVTDGDGRNVFNDGTDAGSDVMRHAVAGCLEAMAASTLIFAPYANSYARLVPHAHAPTGICWAYENRTASLRIPAAPGVARRIEHRVAGGDCNPYLLLAVILGSALDGVERGLTPPPVIEGNAYAQDLPGLAGSWVDAVDAFEASAAFGFLPALLRENLVRTKRQEMALVEGMSEAELRDLHFDRA